MIIIIIFVVIICLNKFTAVSWWNLIEEWHRLSEVELYQILTLIEKEKGTEYITLLTNRIDKLIEFKRKWWY